MSSNLAGLAGHIRFYPCIIMASEAEKKLRLRDSHLYTELTNKYIFKGY